MLEADGCEYVAKGGRLESIHCSCLLKLLAKVLSGEFGEFDGQMLLIPIDNDVIPNRGAGSIGADKPAGFNPM